jgi:hypothetical protein
VLEGLQLLRAALRVEQLLDRAPHVLGGHGDGANGNVDDLQGLLTRLAAGAPPF